MAKCYFLEMRKIRGPRKIHFVGQCHGAELYDRSAKRVLFLLSNSGIEYDVSN